MVMPSPLLERLRPVRVRDDVFHGRAAPRPARIYGGEVAAQALAAADQTVEPGRLAHSHQCTYLRAGDPGLPIEYRVRRVRDGRSFSTRSVDALQDGRLVLRATVGYHVQEDGFSHELPMPSVPEPAGLASIRDLSDAPGRAWGDWATDLDELDIRPVPGDLDDAFGGRRFWCRYDVEAAAPALGPVLTTYLSDLTMVASVRLPHEPSRTKEYLMTTLTHGVYFHRSYDASDWVLVDHWSPVASHARGLAVAHLYSREGHLVATAIQEGLARPLSAS